MVLYTAMNIEKNVARGCNAWTNLLQVKDTVVLNKVAVDELTLPF